MITTDDPTAQNRAHRKIIVFGLAMVMFLSAIEATIVATAMPTIVGDLGGMSLFGLVGSSYLLASTVMIPLYGRLADLRGRKKMMMVGITLFLLGSTVCAISHKFGILVIGRVIQGLGAGAIQPITLTLIGDLFTLEERGRIQGLMGAIWGSAGICGPLVGAFLVEHPGFFGWRSIFWFNIPFGVLAAFIISRNLREPLHRGEPPHIDWIGAALLISGSGALLIASGGVHTAVMGVLGLLLLAGLIVVEARVREPLLPLPLLTRRDIAIGCMSALLMGGCFMGIVNYLPLYIQTGLGHTPQEAGSSLTPLLVGWPIASTTTSFLLVRTGFRTPLLIGSVALATATLGLHLWTLHPIIWILWPVMFLMGVGLGLSTTSVIVAIQTSVRYNQRGLATALNMFSRSMGGAVGVGIAGMLLGIGINAHDNAGIPSADPETLTSILSNVFIALALVAACHVPLCFLYPPRSTRRGDADTDVIAPALME
ncbi:MFS transporter [Candidatus Sumerlaeota bacterium]|nr:MFS transporter [Candidatus Sumerlaeota bacterium]